MTDSTDESGRFDRREEEALERALTLLGEDIVFPETPDLAGAVRTRITESSPGRPLHQIPAMRWPLAALAALFVGALVLSIPGTRSTVAGWLEIAGIRIETGDDAQTVVPVSLGGDLILGRPVSLAEAQSAVSFEVLAPPGMPVGPEIYLDHRDGTAVISLVYPASGTLPSIGDSGAGMLLMLFDPAGDTDAYIKRTAARAAPEFLIVNGSWGAWIEDGSLAIPGDAARADVERPSAHVLIWGVGGIAIRMETNLPRDEALAIARTLVPVIPAAPSSPIAR